MKNKWAKGIALVILALMVLAIVFYIRSNQPKLQAKKETIQLAEKYADLKKVENFYWYTRDQSYFSVTGTNESGEEIVVIIPETGDKVSIYDQSEGLTETKVKEEVQKKYPNMIIEKSALGFYEGEPVWEVTAKSDEGYFSYYLIQFKTGEWVKTIENI